MKTSDILSVLSLSISRCEVLLEEAAALHLLISRGGGLSIEQKEVVVQFSDVCLQRAKSIFNLLRAGDVWSADILLRTLVEGTAKFAYLFYKADGRDGRFDEYLRVLPEIEEIRTSERAEQTLMPFPDGRDRYSLIARMILAPDEITRLREKYPPKLKRSIERRWTLLGLVAEVDSVTNPVGGPLQMFLHQYTGSSRMAHMDSVTVRGRHEREARPPNRAKLGNAAHASRIVTDCFSCAAIRLSYGIRNVGEDIKPLESLVEKFETLVFPINFTIQELNMADIDRNAEMLKQARPAMPRGSDAL